MTVSLLDRVVNFSYNIVQVIFLLGVIIKRLLNYLRSHTLLESIML